MTIREFYVTIADGSMTEEVIEKAKELLAKHDDTLAANRAKAAEKAAEKAPERKAQAETMVRLMTAEPKSATQLIEEAGLEISPQLVSRLLAPFIEDGAIGRVQFKPEGAKAKIVGYVVM